MVVYVSRNDDADELTANLCLIGLVGIADPPKPGVAEAVAQCREAGIRVMMVTGDHPTTALAVARAVNIVTHRTVRRVAVYRAFSITLALQVRSIADVKLLVESAPDDEAAGPRGSLLAGLAKRVFSKATAAAAAGERDRRFVDAALVVAGKDLAGLGAAHWDAVLRHRQLVFARTTPQQKLQIVLESQRRGDVTAVTGWLAVFLFTVFTHLNCNHFYPSEHICLILNCGFIILQFKLFLQFVTN